MPDILVKPTRHPSPVAERKRHRSIRVLFPYLFDEKTVRFASNGSEIQEIANRETYTKKEKDACWYQKAEYRRMKLTRNLAEKQLGRGKPLPEDEDVACGLESPEDSKLRATCSMHSVRSVLIEQEIQKWETEGDPHQAISDVYFHSSFACRLDARERAVRLEAQLTPGRWEQDNNTSSSNSQGTGSHGEASAPAMPIREESIRGNRGFCAAPVRQLSFSETTEEASWSEGDFSEADDDDTLDESFHNEPCLSTALPQLPKRRSSLGPSDEASWAGAQRAAASTNLAGSLAI